MQALTVPGPTATAEGGRHLAFTGVEVASMAEVAAFSGAFGALLVAMGSIGRRRKARP
jgi:hypothetical protein